jgi:THO complex subunit 2
MNSSFEEYANNTARSSLPTCCDVDLSWVHEHKTDANSTDKHIETGESQKQVREHVPEGSKKLTQHSETSRKKFCRVNTHEHYQQRKFELISEDTEGFAELLGTLSADAVCVKLQDWPTQLTKTFSGSFGLELNRAVDAFYSWITNAPRDETTYSHITNLEQSWDLSQIAGYRFKRRGIKEVEGKRIPIVSEQEWTHILNSIYPHCQPSDSVIHEDVKIQVVNPTREIRADSLHKLKLIDELGSMRPSSIQSSGAIHLQKLGLYPYFLQKTCMKGLYLLNAKVAANLGLDSNERGRQLTNFYVNTVFVVGPYLCKNLRTAWTMLNHFADSRLETSACETVLAICILPGLAFMKPNPLFCGQLWRLLERFPFSVRRKIYKSASIRSYDMNILRMRNIAKRSINRVLRRISHQNTKEFGRRLGKLALCFPILVCDSVLEQVQAYPNMVTCLVEGLKYCHPVVYDILTHTMLDQFASSRRKLKDDGQNLSLWFASLSSFSGALHRRYSKIDLRELLKYILASLTSAKTIDIYILKDLITQMTGIEVLQDISASEIEKYCCGELLQQAYSSALNTNRRAKGLMHLRCALEGCDAPAALTLKLLLALAKAPDQVHMSVGSTQLKFISKLLDDQYGILLQYVRFLQSAFSMHEYTKLLPNLPTLLSVCKLEPAIVFELYRPALNQHLEEHMRTRRQNAMITTKWKEMVSYMESVLSNTAWEKALSEIYLIFWTLDISDIYIPEHLYSKHLLLKDQGNATTEQIICTKTSKIGEDIFRVRLRSEFESLKKRKAAYEEYLLAHRATWMHGVDQRKWARTFLRHCIFPRSTVSHVDAKYSSTFVSLLIREDYLYISILDYYDALYAEITPFVSRCSELESKFMSTYFADSLRQLMCWKSTKQEKANECTASSVKDNLLQERSDADISCDDLCRIMYKWEHRLTKAVLQSLAADEYLQVANMLNVLIKIVDSFPTSPRLGDNIYRRVQRIKLAEQREDLVTISSRYLTLLDAARPRWS